MNTFRKYSALLLCTGISMLGIACSGSSEETPGSEQLTLEVDPATIVADGTQAASFTVTYGSEDVTDDAVITCTTDNTTVSGATFTTTVANTYSFRAAYDGQTSPAVTVKATEAEIPPVESQFVRHICVMEFTGQWCAKCPQGFNYMTYVLSTFDAETHVIALHDNSSGQDEFAEPLQPTQLAIFRAFALTGYPSAVVDLREGGSLSGSTAFKDYLGNSLNDYPAHCGVAVKSTYDQASGQADIAVRLTSEKSEAYRIAVFVVEDRIVAEQNNGGTHISDYTHRHVGRQMLSASYKGDSLGTVEAGKEVTKSYSLTVDSAWNLENTTIYALGISADGYVNNMAVCQIVNGDTDYDYIKE